MHEFTRPTPRHFKRASATPSAAPSTPSIYPATLPGGDVAYAGDAAIAPSIHAIIDAAIADAVPGATILAVEEAGALLGRHFAVDGVVETRPRLPRYAIDVGIPLAGGDLSLSIPPWTMTGGEIRSSQRCLPRILSTNRD